MGGAAGADAEAEAEAAEAAAAAKGASEGGTEGAGEEGELFLLVFLALLGGSSLEDSAGWVLFVPSFSLSLTSTPAALSFSSASFCSSSPPCSALRRLSGAAPSRLADK